LAEVLDEARRDLPRTDREPDYVLCLSHRRRMQVNFRANRREIRNKRGVVYVKAPTIRPGKQQNMWLFPGQQLIGSTRMGKVLNGCFYVVKSVTAERVCLEGGIELTHQVAGRCLRLAHALTLAGCQGLTVLGRIRIEDTGSPHFMRRHLFVALSRATAFNLVEVC
jgi:hypothetical protein